MCFVYIPLQVIPYPFVRHDTASNSQYYEIASCFVDSNFEATMDGSNACYDGYDGHDDDDGDDVDYTGLYLI